jgi:hypothetical protein
MSINRAQALALTEGFVDDNGGEEKDGLVPRETLTELFLLVGEFIEDCQENLEKSGSNASGKGSSSIKADEPKESGSTISVAVKMSYYLDFVNKGVKGTRSGKSTAGYSFKSEFPSENMVKSLQRGINSSKRKTTNVNRSKTIYANEIKNVKISDVTKAYGAGRNIKMYGIAPTGFLDKAVVTTTNKIGERLGKVFKIDILNSI